jgi:UDP:flavonoid glycosyltransferase YjiC (YdhE family)
MARVLSCWEMGNGNAYLVSLAAHARVISKAGHEVQFAVRDLSHAERILGRHITYYQAPTTTIPPRLRLPNPMTFADVLINLGWGNPAAVTSRVRAWRRLIDLVKPDIVRCAHAPGALLAVRGTPIRSVTLGIGFLVPPDRSPLPLLRTWAKDTSIERMAAREQGVLEGMNQGLDAIGAPRVSSIGALYNEADIRELFTYPELDDYGPRDNVKYLGNFQRGMGAAPEWPAVPGRKIFAYLEPLKQVEVILKTLAASGQPVLVYLPQASPELMQRYASGNLRITDRPLAITETVASCDFGVSHVGLNIAASFLAAGKPQLCLPKTFPERVTAEKIVASGAGLISRFDAASFGAALTRLLEEKSFHDKARAAAARVAHFSLPGALQSVRDSIDMLHAAGPRQWGT